MLNTRGFLGPIGDDLPSLVPLLLALIIFFSTFTLTFNLFSGRSADFAADLDALAVARTLKGSSYIAGSKHFSALCNSLTVYNIKYVAGLTDVIMRDGKEIDTFNLDFVEEGDFPYLCTNLSDGEELSEESTADRSVLTRVYAVALEQPDRIVKPVHLVVVVWR